MIFLSKLKCHPLLKLSITFQGVEIESVSIVAYKEVVCRFLLFFYSLVLGFVITSSKTFELMFRYILFFEVTLDKLSLRFNFRFIFFTFCTKVFVLKQIR